VTPSPSPSPSPADYGWADSIGYQLIVDRFANGDNSNDLPMAGAEAAANFMGGDLTGISQKIDGGYFTDLGVNLLILSSLADAAEIAQSRSDGHTASSFDGRWPVDMTAIESRFGSTTELTALLSKAHARNIRVVMEYEMNHVHDSAPVYATHSDWFSTFKLLGGSEIPWDSAAAIRGWFASYLPDINYTVPAARTYAASAALGWVADRGLDGILFMDGRFIDDSMVADYRAAAAGLPQRAALGDVFFTDPVKISPYVGTGKYEGAFDYPLREKLVETVLIRSGAMSDLGTFLQANTGRYAGLMGTILSGRANGRGIGFSLDTPLWTNASDAGTANAWSSLPAQPSGAFAYERLAAAYAIIFSLPGIPILFYGDEVGLAGGGDPDNFRMMQWSGYNAGQDSMLLRIKKLASIRAANSALRRGTFTLIASASDTLVYSMHDSVSTIYVAVNRSDSSQVVSGLPGSTLSNLIDGSSLTGPSATLPPRSVMILK
jgi:glycosidase